MGLLKTSGVRFFRVAGAVALAVPAILLASGVAQAATSSKSYKATWTFKAQPLGICVLFTATGKINYSVAQGPHSAQWTNIKLTAPKLTAAIHAYSGGSCSGPGTVTKLSMGQFWTGYSCSFNPSLSVSAPWGASIGGWPSCGNRKRASLSTTYTTTSPTYTQNNTGSPTTFGNYTAAGPDPAHPCYGVFVSAVAFKGSTSDSFGATQGSSSRKVCL